MNNLKSAVKALEKIKSKPKTNLVMAREALINLKKNQKIVIDDNGYDVHFDDKTQTWSIKNIKNDGTLIVDHRRYYGTHEVF